MSAGTRHRKPPEAEGRRPSDRSDGARSDGPPDDGVDRARFQRHLGRSEFYPYAGPPEHVDVVNLGRRRGLEVSEIRFPSPLPSGDPTTDTVTCRFFDPRWRVHDRRAARPVVLLHGFGARRLSVWESTAAALALYGFPTLLVGLPFICERRPAGAGRGSPYTSTDAAVALPAYEQAVADARAALDCLLSNRLPGGPAATEPVEPVVAGVSLGAFIAVISAAVEPRFRSLVSILGGADLDTVVFGGIFRGVIQRQLDRAGVRLDNRRRARAAFRDYLRTVREAAHPLDVEAPYHFFLFDPLTFAHHVRNRPALLINATFDPVVPRAAAAQLWLELGRPPMVWMWGTHWVGGPWRPFIAGHVARFLSALPPGASRTPADSRAEPAIP